LSFCIILSLNVTRSDGFKTERHSICCYTEWFHSLKLLSRLETLAESLTINTTEVSGGSEDSYSVLETLQIVMEC